MNEFEKKLKDQTPRALPPEWRSEILGALNPASSVLVSETDVTPWLDRVIALLWPNPKAWAGLAAVWVFILTLHLFTNAAAPTPKGSQGLTPADYLRAVAEQNQMIARLFEERPNAIEKPKFDRPPRRSDRLSDFAFA